MAEPSENERHGPQPSPEVDEAEALPLVLLDPEEPDPDRLEALASALGRAVQRVDPRQLDAAALEVVAGAAAVVLPWDLGFQSGLDLLEALRLAESTRRVPVLVASARPTRAQLGAALRAGARGFARLPYDADELSARLAAVTQAGAEPA